MQKATRTTCHVCKGRGKVPSGQRTNGRGASGKHTTDCACCSGRGYIVTARSDIRPQSQWPHHPDLLVEHHGNRRDDAEGRRED